MFEVRAEQAATPEVLVQGSLGPYTEAGQGDRVVRGRAILRSDDSGENLANGSNCYKIGQHPDNQKRISETYHLDVRHFGAL